MIIRPDAASCIDYLSANISTRWRALRRILGFGTVMVGLAGATALAGGGPQNVVVVANPRDPDSLAVANAYVALRQIPATNVIYIPWAPNARSTPGATYRDKLLKPLLAELDRRQLRPHVDIVAFSCGYPYMVIFNDVTVNQGTSRQGAAVASWNSAAFLYQDILEGGREAFAVDANGYFAPAVAGKTKSLAFSSQHKWAGGSPTGAASGRRFLLATALGVTYGRGNTTAEIIKCLKRAKIADGTAPRGTIYYMQNDNIRSKVRHATYPAAIAELRSLGVKAELLRGVAPVGKADVAGLTTGTSHLQLPASKCKFVPGALVDNLTSAAGQLLVPHGVPNPQTPLSDFLRAGATGASGTVVEPFAIAAKFPSAALHVHYARGLCLAEAFYRSIAGPYQLLIVGDPLCQPWAVPPVVTVAGLTESAQLSGAVELTPSARYPDRRSTSRFELYVDGVRTQSIAPGRSFPLDTTALADGWHEIRVVAIDNTDVAAQGAKIADVHVKNGSDTLQLQIESPQIGLEETTHASVSITAGHDVTIMHNGRSLGRLPAGRGRLKLSGATLGRGKSRLYAIQVHDGKEVRRSRSVTVIVD
ncbi:MAG TPA: hypothetical protein VF175_03455 [Lacipirellula sp.]